MYYFVEFSSQYIGIRYKLAIPMYPHTKLIVEFEKENGYR